MNVALIPEGILIVGSNGSVEMILHLQFVSLQQRRKEGNVNLPVAESQFDLQRKRHLKQPQLRRLLLNRGNRDLPEQCQPQRPQEG